MTEEVILPDPPGTQDSREMTVLRKQTLRFIKENATEITILRGASETSDGAGGYIPSGDLDPILPQEFRLIIQNSQGTNTATRNVDGEVINPAFVMIGTYDCTLERGDRFVHNGHDYRVTFVREDRRYETWAEVEYLG